MRRELFSAAWRETWAIQLSWLNAVLHSSAVVTVSKKGKLPSVSGSIAILPMHGMITQRASIWQEIFGGTSTEQFGAAFIRVVNDDRVSAVVMDVDSPGGTTYGVQELSDIINEGASRKPVIAVGNSLMASAAYWLGSQAGAGKVMASVGADVGSIGVYRMLDDYSEAMAKEGVKVEFVAVPPEKVEDAGNVPLTAEARAHHMEQVQISYDAFTKAVARGRGVTQGNVKKNFGNGRVFKSPQAQEMGLIDRTATLGEVLAELGRSGKSDVSVGASKEIYEDLCHAWQYGGSSALRKVPSRGMRERELAIRTK